MAPGIAMTAFAARSLFCTERMAEPRLDDGVARLAGALGNGRTSAERCQNSENQLHPTSAHATLTSCPIPRSLVSGTPATGSDTSS